MGAVTNRRIFCRDDLDSVKDTLDNGIIIEEKIDIVEPAIEENLGENFVEQRIKENYEELRVSCKEEELPPENEQPHSNHSTSFLSRIKTSISACSSQGDEIERKEKHRIQEKERRDVEKSLFEDLRKCIPKFDSTIPPPRYEILMAAKKYINELENERKEKYKVKCKEEELSPENIQPHNNHSRGVLTVNNSSMGACRFQPWEIKQKVRNNVREKPRRDKVNNLLEVKVRNNRREKLRRDKVNNLLEDLKECIPEVKDTKLPREKILMAAQKYIHELENEVREKSFKDKKSSKKSS